MARLVKPKSNFTVVGNSIFVNKTISWDARGVYSYLLSKPDNYDFAYDRIAGDSADSKEVVLSALKELEQKGYLVRKKLHTGKVDYYLFNSPEENDLGAKQAIALVGKKPSREKPKLGKSLVGNTPTINKTEFNNKTDLNNKTEKPLKKAASLEILEDSLEIEKLRLLFPEINIRQEVESAKDWLKANGVRKKDYLAFMRNWLRRSKTSFQNRGQPPNMSPPPNLVPSGLKIII